MSELVVGQSPMDAWNVHLIKTCLSFFLSFFRQEKNKNKNNKSEKIRPIEI